MNTIPTSTSVATSVPINPTSRIIKHNPNSSFFLFPNTTKIRTVENMPSEDEFTSTVNSIRNIIQARKTRGISMQRRIELYKSLKDQYSKNEIITKFITRRDIMVNNYGIPMCTEEEFYVYRELISEMPFRTIYWGINDRNGRCDWDDNQKNSHQKLVAKMLKDTDLPKKYHPSNYFNTGPANTYYSPCDAFNIYDIYHELLKPIITKNKIKFDNNKSSLNTSQLNGIHYLDSPFSFKDIQEFSIKINSGEINLDNTTYNIFIVPFFDQIRHVTCGALLVNTKDISNPIPSELFILDSETLDANDQYTQTLENLNQTTGDPTLKLTLISYNAQVQDTTNDYDVDFNCALYSVSAMNALVKILGFSKESHLHARLLGQNSLNHIDTEEDHALYAQELAKEMPEFFNFNSESNLFETKDFADRKDENIFRRWYLSRKFLKQLLAQNAAPNATS